MTDFTVTETPEAFDEHEGEIPAAPTSSMDVLRSKSDEIAAVVYYDLDHPSIEGLAVRYAPIPGALGTRLQKEREARKKDDEVDIDLAAQTLVTCCIGVFAKDDDGQPIDDPSEWPKFDATLAKAIGTEAKSARSIVRYFYKTDGFVVSVFNELQDASGFNGADAAKAYAGN
jgi:hypothetical protein